MYLLKLTKQKIKFLKKSRTFQKKYTSDCLVILMIGLIISRANTNVLKPVISAAASWYVLPLSSIKHRSIRTEKIKERKYESGSN